jgi:hypothetical protein
MKISTDSSGFYPTGKPLPRQLPNTFHPTIQCNNQQKKKRQINKITFIIFLLKDSQENRI